MPLLWSEELDMTEHTHTHTHIKLLWRKETGLSTHAHTHTPILHFSGAGSDMSERMCAHTHTQSSATAPV